MNNKFNNWAAEQQKRAREISKDISLQGRKLLGKAKELAAQGQQLIKEKPTVPSLPQRRERYIDANVQQRRAEALATMDTAVRRAYFQEGGIGYYAALLRRYVNVVLPVESEFNSLWAGGYNSCIVPMLWQIEKLEAELEKLRSSAQLEAGDGEGELLQSIRRFAAMADEMQLSAENSWTFEEYKQKLTEYTRLLESGLLDVYKL